MTTAEEARAALLEWMGVPSDPLVDALIAAVRAERLSTGTVFTAGLKAGRADSAETLRALREAAQRLVEHHVYLMATCDLDYYGQCTIREAVVTALAATPAEDDPWLDLDGDREAQRAATPAEEERT